MRIAIINGSPVRKGNTDILSDNFKDGAENSGHIVEKINLRELNINSCNGCNLCQMKKGNPCIQKDDMNIVYNAILNSDMIVWASPLYWMQFSAQIKIVLDRMFALSANAIPVKSTALLIAGASPEDVIKSMILPYYELCFINSMKWIDKGHIIAGNVFTIGDVEKTSYIKKAYELGKSL